METGLRAIEIIRCAEKELRSLLVDAVDRGDYDGVRSLADWAKQLGAMIQNCSGNGAQSLPEAVVEPGPTDRDRPPSYHSMVSQKPAIRQDHAPIPRRKGKRKTNSRKARGRKSTVGEFPKFYRAREDLLKEGWSKREKAVYQHKAPKRILLLLVEAVNRIGLNGDRFSMEQVLPLHDPMNDSEVPTYQAYLSLAWLRKEKIIVQHGRQGYSLPKETDIAAVVEERWQQLASR